MNRTINNIYCFMPVVIFLGYAGVMSLRFGLSFLYMSLILNSLAFLIYVAIYFSLKRSKLKCSTSLVTYTSLVLLACLGGLVATVGEDRETALICGIAIHSVLAFVFVFVCGAKISKNQYFFDKDSGKYFKVKDGRFHELTNEQVQSIPNLGLIATESYKGHFASVGMSNDLSSNEINAHVYTGSISGTDNYINPSSGLPMQGGMSGLDVAGNSWGTNFNDPTNHQPYDSTRGY